VSDAASMTPFDATFFHLAGERCFLSHTGPHTTAMAW
jgi:hypothetical protein